MIQWSFSSLKDFINCPKKYYHVKVAQDVINRPNEKMLYGTAVHKALEDYVRDGTPLAKNYQMFKPHADALLDIPGIRYCEHEMALDRDKNPCEFHAEDRWVRGVVDLLIIDGDIAFIVDYKTGSNKYPDAKQLKLMALMTFIHFPQVKLVKAGLLFVMHNTFIDERYKREDMDKLWGIFTSDLERLKVAYDSNIWPAQPSGLCGWCPVDSCKFYRER
jgi:hypothetical protein